MSALRQATVRCECGNRMTMTEYESDECGVCGAHGRYDPSYSPGRVTGPFTAIEKDR